MPFYLFSLRITAHDEWGQQIANKLHQGIRQLNNNAIDNVWREYKRKAEQHYGSCLKSFSVVHISKLDPRVMKFVEGQAKKKEDKWDSIFQSTVEVNAPFSKNSRAEIQGKTLGERKGN